MKGKFIGKSSMGFQNGATYNIRSDIKMVRKVEVYLVMTWCVFAFMI